MRMKVRMILFVVAACAGLAWAQTADVALVAGNMGRTSCVWNAETVLNPALSLSPPRKTVVSGAEVHFTAAGSTNPASWFLTDNRSGAGLNASGAQTALYIAGPTSDCVDVVEVWDGVNSFGRSQVNIISPGEVARCGKAVIIAGRASSTDPVWPTTCYLANYGYNALRYRGYGRDNIRYLSPVVGADVDGDGLANDIAALSTRANVANTLTNWVGNADKLFVYLVDHGGVTAGPQSEGFFRLSPTETISATELNAWLTALQAGSSKTQVTLMIDCCNSGSFLSALAYAGGTNRVVITACGADEPTIFVSGGLVSFSEAFFSGLMLGLSVGDAYAAARDAMSAYQSAGLDDTGDGVSGAADGARAGGLTVGASFVAGKDVPQIGLVLGNQQLAGDTKATLWASDVVASYAIARVWCLVVPPGYQPDPNNPVTDLPQLELTYNSATGRYEAQYAGFSEEGTYKVIYYAKDIWESVSLPRQSYVVQSGFLERAIIVAGGLTNDSNWAAVDAMGNYAHDIFSARRLSTNAIYYLSVGAGRTSDKQANWANLTGAVTNWAKGSNKLSLYLVGTSCGSNGAFSLNGTETITAPDIDGLLDVYQASNASVTVVMDFDGAGGWVPALAGANRVCVSSTSAGQTASFKNQGLVSFSCFFFEYVFNGLDVWIAFSKAHDLIFNASGRKQASLLDSDGDGKYVSKKDQVPAKQWYLGSAFMTGADAPTLDAVTPDTVLTTTNSLALWASGVADIGGVSNVFCLVTPPGYGGVSDLPQTDLTWNAGTERYEVKYSGFTEVGTYACTYFVLDNKGQLSMPYQTLVDVARPDAYEPDDTPAQASVFEIGGTQTHNLHASNDVDWVKFYAPSGYVFSVQAQQLGTNSDVCLAFFYSGQPDAAPTPVLDLPVADDNGTGTGIVEKAVLDLSGENPLPPGFYYVRVSSAVPRLFGAGSEYQLDIFSGQGGGSLIVVAVDKLSGSLPPPGAIAVVDGVQTQAFGTANSLMLNLPDGIHTVSVPRVFGYLPEEDPALPGQVTNKDSYWYGNPKQALSEAGSPRVALFQFVPVVGARGSIRDRGTGGPVNGAGLVFRARGGPLAGLAYDGFPNAAVYKTLWKTQADGSFPTNLWLPASDWDLAVSAPGYIDRTVYGAVSNLAYGSVANLGTILLESSVPNPDANANGIPDAWERAYGLTNVSATSDADGDGFSDRSEYLAGTDPTNRLSLLRITALQQPTGQGRVLRWSGVSNRQYRVEWTANLAVWPTNQFVYVGGTNAWREPWRLRCGRLFYRIGLQQEPWAGVIDRDLDGLPDDYEIRAGLSIDDDRDAESDQDGDGQTLYQEYVAGTDPTNRLSVFHIIDMIKSPAAGCRVRWTSAAGRRYRVYWSATTTNWPTGQSVVVGATNAWSDASQPRPPVRFYRVGVEWP